MHIRFIYIICFLISNGLFFSSCKKREQDYRDRYVGVYTGTSMSISVWGSSIDTIMEYNVKKTFSKFGDYPSKKIRMDGGEPFEIGEPYDKELKTFLSGASEIQFVYPFVRINHGLAGGDGFHLTAYYYKGVKK